MLRGNLSTRPFYNDRVVTLAIGAVAILVVLLTILNVTQVLSLSARRGEVQRRLDATRTEAADIRARAAALQQNVDRNALQQLAASADEANQLIDQRTFSWTALFGLLERAMPMDVRLVSVSPRVDSTVVGVTMTVVARDLLDVQDFMDALQDTGAFYDVMPPEMQQRDDGTVTAIVDASYLGPDAAAPTPGGRQ
jgi:hypothetical protein